MKERKLKPVVIYKIPPIFNSITSLAVNSSARRGGEGEGRCLECLSRERVLALSRTHNGLGEEILSVIFFFSFFFGGGGEGGRRKRERKEKKKKKRKKKKKKRDKGKRRDRGRLVSFLPKHNGLRQCLRQSKISRILLSCIYGFLEDILFLG